MDALREVCSCVCVCVCVLMYSVCVCIFVFACICSMCTCRYAGIFMRRGDAHFGLDELCMSLLEDYSYDVVSTLTLIHESCTIAGFDQGSFSTELELQYHIHFC